MENMRKIKALHSIRVGVDGVSHRFPAGSVFEIDDVRAESLIQNGYASEAYHREAPTAPIIGRQDTEDLLESNSGVATKKRGRR